MIDPKQALRPLDFVVQLSQKLGPPQPHVVPIDGVRDISTKGWIVGRGQMTAPPRLKPGQSVTGFSSDVELQRGTDVEVYLTAKGTLITTRRSWTRTGGGEEVSQTGQAHETPDSAYQWLLNDGKGKLGPASKQAWSEACRNVPPMAELEFEHVD